MCKDDRKKRMCEYLPRNVTERKGTRGEFPVLVSQAWWRSLHLTDISRPSSPLPHPPSPARGWRVVLPCVRFPLTPSLPLQPASIFRACLPPSVTPLRMHICSEPHTWQSRRSAAWFCCCFVCPSSVISQPTTCYIRMNSKHSVYKVPFAVVLAHNTHTHTL